MFDIDDVKMNGLDPQQMALLLEICVVFLLPNRSKEAKWLRELLGDMAEECKSA